MPTEAGRNFYKRAKRAIEEADEAELTARDTAATLMGRLRVCGPLTFARLLVIPRLSIFLSEHPSLDIDVVLDDRDIDLIAAGIDVALPIGRLPNSAATVRKIGQCQRRMIGTPAYFAARSVPQTRADLPAHLAIVYEQGGSGATWTFWQGNVENHRYRERPSQGHRRGGYSGGGTCRPRPRDRFRVVVRAGAEIGCGHFCAR